MTSMNMDTPRLKKLMVHYVGSKNNAEQLHLSAVSPDLSEEDNDILQDALLYKFKTIPEEYSFHHASSLDFNEVYSYCRRLFRNPEDIMEISASMARHLYEASVHPRVKGGEFYVSYFEGLAMDSRMYKAIGLFKTENKSIFMDVKRSGKKFNLHMKEGVELTKIDKGCLVINSGEKEGYTVLIFDNQSRGEEALYWKETFLGLTPKQNEFHQTQHFLTLTKQFITEQLDTELNVPRTEQVEMLNRSLDYFKGNDSFDINEFQSAVFGSEEIISSFKNFGSRYVEANDYDLAASFDISPDAVKKQSRIFKSVLKLDKNFHIYIHGRTDLIERGVDDDGRKFYKIYYQEEA
jgi:hypothetical protein